MDESQNWEATLGSAVRRIQDLRECDASRHKHAEVFLGLGLFTSSAFVEVEVADQGSLLRFKAREIDKLHVLRLVGAYSDHFVVDYALNILVGRKPTFGLFRRKACDDSVFVLVAEQIRVSGALQAHHQSGVHVLQLLLAPEVELERASILGQYL